MGHPVTNWIWLLKDIEGSAIIEGQANAPVIFKEANTQQIITVSPDASTGHFKTSVPEGKYIVISNGRQQMQTFLPGGFYHLECRKGYLLSYEVLKQTSANGEVTIKLKVQGNGNHHFNIRTDNLTITEPSKQLNLKPGISVNFVWHGRITSQDTSWVVVIVPDNNLFQRKEVRGAIWE